MIEKLKTRVTLFCILFLFSVSFPVTAEERPQISPPRWDDSVEIELDGILDEPIWENSEVIEGFHRTAPVYEGAPAHETDVRIAYNRYGLFVAFECSVPGEDVRVNLAPRDSYPSGDFVTLKIDTFGDHQRSYEFIINAAGSQSDGRQVVGQGPDRSWDTTFHSAVSVSDEGYVVELNIPFRDLRFAQESEQEWGIQFGRRLWKAEERGVWPAVDPEVRNVLSQFAVLHLGEIASSSNVQLFPTLTVGWGQEDEVSPSCDYGAGLGDFTMCGADISYGLGGRVLLGSALTLDTVFNPDFSQIEADPSQITLNNRFAIYLEERRPFFLEGQDIFEVGGLVYTRSIGQPIAGLKLTGNALDRTRIGVLTAHDLDPPDSVLDDSFTILRDENDRALVQSTTAIIRVQQDILEASRVGLILTDREYTGDARGFSRVLASDYRFEFADNWSVEGKLGLSWWDDLENQDGVGGGTDFEANWRTESWNAELGYGWLSPDFRAESGYVTQTGFQYLHLKFDHYRRSERAGFRFLSPGTGGFLLYDQESEQVTEGYSWLNNFWMFGKRTHLFTSLEQSFEKYEGIGFQMTSGHVGVGSGYWPEFEPYVYFDYGQAIIRDSQFWVDEVPGSGTQLGLYVGVESSPSSQLQLDAQFNLRSLYESGFNNLLSSQKVYRLRSTYLFNNVVNMRFITEFVDPAEEISFDFLLSIMPSPGTVFFLGYREVDTTAPGWLDDENPLGYGWRSYQVSGWRSLERNVFLKFSYLWAL